MNVRNDFIEKLNKFTKEIYSRFSDHEIEILYTPSVLEEQFMKHINNNQKQDILYRTSIVGPHRDEFTILFNKQNAKSASQGEIRLIVIAIKLGLLKLIEESTKSEVILLLDDVLSELDKSVQNTFLRSLPKNIQVIMNSAINIESEKIQIIKLKENKDGRKQ